jgi:hypothetical protein
MNEKEIKSLAQDGASRTHVSMIFAVVTLSNSVSPGTRGDKNMANATTMVKTDTTSG